MLLKLPVKNPGAQLEVWLITFSKLVQKKRSNFEKKYKILNFLQKKIVYVMSTLFFFVDTRDLEQSKQPKTL